MDSDSSAIAPNEEETCACLIDPQGRDTRVLFGLLLFENETSRFDISKFKTDILSKPPHTTNTGSTDEREVRTWISHHYFSVTILVSAVELLSSRLPTFRGQQQRRSHHRAGPILSTSLTTPCSLV